MKKKLTLREQVTTLTVNANEVRVSLADGEIIVKYSRFTTPKLRENKGYLVAKYLITPIINMANIYIADSGRIRNLDDVELAEDIIKLKNTKDQWVVIDKLVQLFGRIAEEEEKAVHINIGQYREQLKDKKFGQTELGKDQERRFKLSFPYRLHQMIKAVYKDEILFDDKFFDEFAKRYPDFRVAEQ